MESHPIAVISDTHGILRPEVVQHIEACEAVFHGGDMDNPEILRRLQALRPVYAVAGNADADWAGGLPGELTAELYGFRFYMIHNRRAEKAGPITSTPVAAAAGDSGCP